MPMESNISKQLTEKTTKIVIVIILSNLFVLPFFEYSTFYQYNSSFSLGFDMLVDFSDAYYNGSLSKNDYNIAY